MVKVNITKVGAILTEQTFLLPPGCSALGRYCFSLVARPRRCHDQSFIEKKGISQTDGWVAEKVNAVRILILHCIS